MFLRKSIPASDAELSPTAANATVAPMSAHSTVAYVKRRSVIPPSQYLTTNPSGHYQPGNVACQPDAYICGSRRRQRSPERNGLRLLTFLVQIELPRAGVFCSIAGSMRTDADAADRRRQIARATRRSGSPVPAELLLGLLTMI